LGHIHIDDDLKQDAKRQTGRLVTVLALFILASLIWVLQYAIWDLEIHSRFINVLLWVNLGYCAIVTLLFFTGRFFPLRLLRRQKGRVLGFIQIGKHVLAMSRFFMGPNYWFSPSMELKLTVFKTRRWKILKKKRRWKIRVTFTKLTPDAAVAYHLWTERLAGKHIRVQRKLPVLPDPPPDAPFRVSVEPYRARSDR